MTTRDLQHQDTTPQASPWTWRLLLVAVTGLAFAFRYYRLGDMPPGLHYDEAFNGIDVAALLDAPLGQWPIFFTGNFGREPLFNYILAGATALFGPGLMTLRLVSALVVALPLGIYFVQNPVSFATRLDQVSILEHGAGAIWDNVWVTLQMAAIAGDANPRANLPGRPVFDAALLAPFVIGFVYLLRHALRPAALFVLAAGPRDGAGSRRPAGPCCWSAWSSPGVILRAGASALTCSSLAT